MNSDPNSDSEQCTESRLGWVHRVHTMNPSCAPTTRALRRGCSHSVVSQLPSVTIQNCIATQAPASHALRACHARCRACREQPPASYRSLGALYHDPKSPLSHDTMFCIATPPTTPCRGLIRLCCGRDLACPCEPAARPMSRYSLLYHDSTQGENGQ